MICNILKNGIRHSAILNLIVFCFLCSAARAAMITSTATGDFSAGATWVGGVAPADTDGFTVAAGHTVTFDMDQSAWAGMAASTIEATGTLICDTAAGSYYLKMNGDLTLAGTLQAGTSSTVPLPATITFTVNFSSGSHSIVIDDTTGSLLLYCNEPTYKFVTLTAQEPAVETVLAVDTDVTGDIWANGDIVAISDLVPVGTSTRDSEEDTIAGIAAGTITLTGGLAAQKEIGAKLILVSRNIRLINSTDFAVKNGSTGTVYSAVEIYNCSGGGYYSIDNATLGGSIHLPTGAAVYGIRGSNLTVDIAMSIDGTSNTTGLSSIYNGTIVSGSIIAGYNNAISIFVGWEINGEIAGCYAATNGGRVSSINGLIKGCRYAISAGSIIYLSGDVSNVDRAISGSNGIIIANCEIGASIGGVTSTRVLAECGSAIDLYNVLFSATTEFSSYNSIIYRSDSSYVQSFDHDQATNAYKAWCLGGIVTSQTASPPTGYSIWYEHACESADHPCFRQFETVVQPGTAIEVEGYIRIADAADHSTYPPALQIVDASDDPLVRSEASYLDEDEIADPDGSDSSWQAVDVIWANTGDSPRTVIVRMYAQHATGDVDEVWNIADYQDQINTILSVVRPVNTTVSVSDTTTSFTLTAGENIADTYNNQLIQLQDADDTGDYWVERAISTWTSGRVVTVDTAFPFTPAVGDLARIIGTGYGGPVDNGSIADEVVAHMDANSTDLDTIIADTSAYDTDAEYAAAIWNAPVGSYGGAGTYGQILEDINDVNDAGIADAVWDELVADHTGETTFGGEVGGLDPNITLILADTNELQTDWTDGGRLDLLIDAIKYKTDLISLVDTVVKDANDANNFTIEDGTDVNDAYWFMAIQVEDADGNTSKEIRWINFYDENSGDPNVWVDEPFSFTPAVGDVVHVMGTAYGGFLYRIMRNLEQTRGVLNVIDKTRSGTGGLDRAGAIRIDALGDDP